MPSTWRKAKISGFSRFVAGLRSRRGVGDHPSPLVVQAGFPTSVADLVIKNSGRLRKTSPSRSVQLPSSASTSSSTSSSSKKKPPRPPSPTEHSAVTSPRNPLGSELYGPEEPRGSVEADGGNDERSDLSAASPSREISATRAVSPRREISATRAVSPRREISATRAVSPRREIPAASGVASRAGARDDKSSISDAELNRRNKEVPARLGFQARVVLLLILAVCTKDVVVGIMVSAFLLLFFECVGCRLINWWRSRGDTGGNASTAADTACDPGIAEAPLGGSQSSRTDQFAMEIRSSVSLSSMADGSSDFSAKFDELLPSSPTGAEREEEIVGSWRSSAVSDGEIEATKMKKKKKKKRKFWSKVVKEKFRSKGKKGKKEAGYILNSESLSDTREGGEISIDRGEMSAGSLDSSDSEDNEEDENIDDDNGSSMHHDEILRSENFDQSMENGIMANKGAVTKAKSISLVLMVVVLSGLIGGRFLALTLTVTCCYLLKLAGSLRRQKTE